MKKLQYAGFVCLALLHFSFCFVSSKDANKQAEELFSLFAKAYPEQNIPAFGFDYRENFRNIPDLNVLVRQQTFFRQYQKELAKIDRKKLNAETRLDNDHLQYELALNLERLRLQTLFRNQKEQQIPQTGLSELPNAADWYQFYIRYYTSTTFTADALMAFGLQEVKRVQNEIRKLRKEMGYETDSAGFYQFLQKPEFLLTEEEAIAKNYQEIQKTVFRNYEKLFPSSTTLQPVAIETLPEAGPQTPPGYYNLAADNENGKATFYYNFFGRRHNLRIMDWMFLHEGIPGHHYQVTMRAAGPVFAEHFYYPANSEGWAAYVENYGKALGMYATPAQELGKWEWDLVRSARVVLDVGIHAKGWTKEQALDYWRQAVPGQEAIAEREVNRCTNWAGQVLSYKAGEKVIKELLEKQKNAAKNNFDLKSFHAEYLKLGSRPMEVVQKAMLEKTVAFQP